MDLDALGPLFEPGPETPTPAPGAAQGEPAAGGLCTATGDPGASPEAVREAREERAAILQFEAGLTREAAEAEAVRLHPDPEAPGDAPLTWRGFTLAELQAAAGDDWPEVEGRPEALALLLETGAKRAAGEVPPHYTRAAECATCGPVWLWGGAPARVLACPWCLSPPADLVPRPPSEPEGSPHV